MTSITVIHHSADFDGIFCRQIARKFLPDANLIGWDFGDAPLGTVRLTTGAVVYVMDLPIDKVFAIKPTAELCRNVIWIDHHKSSIDSHPSDVRGYRIDGVAACRLAWQWFQCCDGNWNAPRTSGIAPAGVLPQKHDFINRNVEEPLSVRLAGEYDIWDKRDPRAELFQHGLRSQGLTDQDWQDLLATTPYRATIVDDFLKQGQAVQYAKTHENESIIKHSGFTIRFEGLTFLACNHARYNSLLFTAGLTDEHDACLGFNWTGKRWKVSLYHAPGKEHIDLSVIAMKHGGGGHRGACGFETDSLPFDLGIK